MNNPWFTRPFSSTVIIVFWLVVLVIFLTIYFFYPSLFNQLKETSYQNTPYVNTPLHPT